MTLSILSIDRWDFQKTLDTSDEKDAALNLINFDPLKSSLYCGFIQDARLQSDFDRVGLFRYDREARLLQGVIGSDAEGRPEDITGYIYSVSGDEGNYLKDVARGEAPYRIVPSGQKINDHVTPYDRASVPILLDGEIVGVLAADNMATKREITRERLAALAKEGMTIGAALADLQAAKPVDLIGIAYDHLNEGVCLIGSDGWIVSANVAFRKNHGYSAEEEVKAHYHEVLFPYLEDGSVSPLGADFRESCESNLAGEFILRRRDDALVPFRLQILDFPKETKFHCKIAIDHELTDEKEKNKAPKDNEKKFYALLEYLPDFLALVDESGHILSLPPTRYPLLGYPCENLRGRSIFDLIHPDDRAEVERKFCELLYQPDRRAFGTFRIRRKNGQWRWFEAIGVNRLNEAEIGAVILNYRDITTAKLAEEALKESNLKLQETLTELRETQRRIIQQERLYALGEMASGIAHDFSNSLVPMLGLSELLLDYPDGLEDPARVRESLEMIRAAAKDASHTVARLKDFYRLHDEGEGLIYLDLNQVVERSVSLSRPRWRNQRMAQGSEIRVETNLGQSLFILGDESALRESLINIIFNATDAMPMGGTISLKTYAKEEEAFIEVTDTGQGMSEEVLKRCMEPFFTTKGQKGTGLGLSTAFNVMKKHHGSIEAQSQLGAGTTFRLRFPVMNKINPEIKPISPMRPPEERDALSILLVDDEHTVREVVSELLMSMGHHVTVAHNGKAGLEKFNAGTFDLLITDQVMPEMSGESLAKEIKAVHPDFPIMMMTGFRKEAFDASVEIADRLIRKPVGFVELGEAVASVMDAAMRQGRSVRPKREDAG